MELVVVVLILGVLATVAVGKYSDLSDEVIASALQTNLDIMSDQIEMHAQIDGSIPPTIDPSWFSSRRLPPHPQNESGIPTLHVFTADDRMHPVNKVLTPTAPGAYWYNPNVGVVRARVADQGSDTATLQFYNLVNQSDEADVGSLGNYVKGAGS